MALALRLVTETANGQVPAKRREKAAEIRQTNFPPRVQVTLAEEKQRAAERMPAGSSLQAWRRDFLTGPAEKSLG